MAFGLWYEQACKVFTLKYGLAVNVLVHAGSHDLIWRVGGQFQQQYQLATPDLPSEASRVDAWIASIAKQVKPKYEDRDIREYLDEEKEAKPKRINMGTWKVNVER